MRFDNRENSVSPDSQVANVTYEPTYVHTYIHITPTAFSSLQAVNGKQVMHSEPQCCFLALAASAGVSRYRMAKALYTPTVSIGMVVVLEACDEMQSLRNDDADARLGADGLDGARVDVEESGQG